MQENPSDQRGFFFFFLTKISFIFKIENSNRTKRIMNRKKYDVYYTKDDQREMVDFEVPATRVSGVVMDDIIDRGDFDEPADAEHFYELEDRSGRKQTLYEFRMG